MNQNECDYNFSVLKKKDKQANAIIKLTHKNKHKQ